jgi:DNA-binding transcriptional LysR family regulator
MEVLQAAPIGGFGIAYMPDYLVKEAIQGGNLQIKLDEYLAKPGQFWALWPSSRHLSPKVRFSRISSANGCS